MQKYPVTMNLRPNVGGLDSAISGAIGRAITGGKLIGVSFYSLDRPIDVLLDDTAQQADETIVDGLCAVHDPVFISSDKQRINADDTDRCTITVNAPKAGALPVVLSVVVNDSIPVDFPIPLTAGIGSDYLTCKDMGTIKVSVKNGVNRCVDVLTIQAV